MRKLIAILCTITLAASSVAVYGASSNPGDQDGDVVPNPWEDLFTTSAPATTTEPTTEAVEITTTDRPTESTTVSPTETTDNETEAPTASYNPGFDPSSLEYTSVECTGTPGLTLDYSIYSTTIEGILPWYGDGGSTLSLQFSSAAGIAEEILIDGQAAGDGVVKENVAGLVKIDPTKLADNAYTIIKVVTEKGEFVFVIKKGTPTAVYPTTVAPTETDTKPVETTTDKTNETTTPVETTTVAPTTQEPTTVAPTTVAPTTQEPTTVAPTTQEPTTVAPTTVAPTTQEPTTVEPTTVAPGTQETTTVSPTTVGQNTTTVVSTDAPTTKAKAPAKAKIKKVKSKKKSAKKVKVTLKKIKGAVGYQVAIYKTKKNAKKNKKALVKKVVTKRKVTIKSKKLKNKKKLYVKARAYVLDAKGKKLYGKWSNIKKVKIKK